MKKWILSGLIVFIGAFGLFWFNTEKFEHRPSAKIENDFSGKRNISSTSSLKEVNQAIISIKSSSEIIPLLNKLETLHQEGKDPAISLYYAVLSPLKHLEGIIWRLRALVERSGIAHIQALSLIRKAYHQDYMYGPHLKAILNYLVEPNINETQFTKFSDVQDFLNNTIKPTLTNSLNITNDIMKNTDESFSFQFDGFLLTGLDEENGITYLSESKRYEKKIVRAHINFVVAGLHRAIGGIEYAINYDIEKAPEFLEQIVKATAINNLKQKFLMRSLPKPVTPKEIISITNNKKKFGNFLTLRVPFDNAKASLESSMNHYYQARLAELKGLNESIDTVNISDDKGYILNPKLLQIDRDDVSTNLKNIIYLYEQAKEGKTAVVTADATGHQIKVNIAALFKPYKDLKQFLPSSNGFDQNLTRGGLIKENGSKVKHKVTGQNVFAWNYQYGRPISWQYPTFGGFLPDATNENMYELARQLKLTASLRDFLGFLPIP